MSYQTILKITQKYPRINIDWLINGEGEMIKKEYPILNDETNVSEPKVSYLEKKLIQLQTEHNELMKKYISLLEQNQAKK